MTYIKVKSSFWRQKGSFFIKSCNGYWLLPFLQNRLPSTPKWKCLATPLQNAIHKLPEFKSSCGYSGHVSISESTNNCLSHNQPQAKNFPERDPFRRWSGNQWNNKNLDGTCCQSDCLSYVLRTPAGRQRAANSITAQHFVWTLCSRVTNHSDMAYYRSSRLAVVLIVYTARLRLRLGMATGRVCDDWQHVQV